MKRKLMIRDMISERRIHVGVVETFLKSDGDCDWEECEVLFFVCGEVEEEDFGRHLGCGCEEDCIVVNVSSEQPKSPVTVSRFL